MIFFLNKILIVNFLKCNLTTQAHRNIGFHIEYYRIVAKDIFAKTSYSSVQLVYLCGTQQSSINIYPTVVQNSFTISGLRPEQTQNMAIDLVDAAGQKIVTEQMPYIFGSYTVYLKNKLAPGAYFIILKNTKTGIVNLTKKIIVSN